jgi:hypothetical protein
MLCRLPGCNESLEGKKCYGKILLSRYMSKEILGKIYTEPRAICEDCGTQLGVNSVRNIRRGKNKSLCTSCSMNRRVGTGKDF